MSRKMVWTNIGWWWMSRKTMGNTRKDNWVFENDISISRGSSWDIMGVQDVRHGNLKNDMLLVKLLLSSLLEALCHHCHRLPPPPISMFFIFIASLQAPSCSTFLSTPLVFFYFFQCFHVLQFYCKFSSSIVLLLWFCLLWFHLQQLCLLPPIIPSPTSATPSCIINIAIFFYLCYFSLPSFGFVLWLQSSHLFFPFPF